VTEIGKRPGGCDDIQGQYLGVIKFRADLAGQLVGIHAAMDREARYDGQDFENLYMTSFLQHLIDIGRDVQSVPSHNGCLEVDSVSDLEIYDSLAVSGGLDRFFRLASIPIGRS
jgi:choline kinase